jgi:hypothetical protein
MYTKTQFGLELKKRVQNKQDTFKIGEWAHTMYLEHIEDIDLEFRDILLTLNTMELGEEFAYSYEELVKIADDLIKGKNPTL